MRIIVTGATGNVGTAVLRRLQREPGVEIVAIARRLPDAQKEPYAGVTWHALDVGAERAVPQLIDVFRGADAVIHLAWLIQPSWDVLGLRRANMDGTVHVLRAVSDAGVPHLAYASSVGAYSAGPKKTRVDEGWPTGGLHTSNYSTAKAANERSLDIFEATHPDVSVTRLRPGIIFQGDESSHIQDLFLGRWLPTRWIGRLRLPVIPLPHRLIFQGVHTDDVAEAFWLAVQRRARGAFNIAAEPIIDRKAIAEAMSASRVIGLDRRALRTLVTVLWRLHIIPVDPGWLDMATFVPTMSTRRAREELGWEPTVSATDALRQVVAGLAAHTEVPASPALRRWSRRTVKTGARD